MSELFGFVYAMELYVPAAKRRYGYWVMPILHGDALIGRLDLAVDRSRRVLMAKAVHAEPDADSVELVRPVPRGWSELAG